MTKKMLVKTICSYVRESLGEKWEIYWGRGAGAKKLT